MPEKVRVSPATALQLSTGDGQAALVLVEDEPPDDDELPEEELPEEELPDDELPEDELPDDEDEPESDDEEDDVEDSDLAGTLPLPEERLSVR